MSERIEIGINDVYLAMKAQSSVKVMNDKALVKKWLTDDPRGLIDKAVESIESDPFETMRMKRCIDVLFDKFEPKKVTIEPRK